MFRLPADCLSLTLVTGSALVGAHPVAAAPATQSCNLNGQWQIGHANRAYAIMDIIHRGNRLTGSGREGRNSGVLSGGRVHGREVYFRIKWSNGHIGEYSGRVNLRGKLSGLNHDVNIGQQTSWYVADRFECVQN
jgi:hypothetical protein